MKVQCLFTVNVPVLAVDADPVDPRPRQQPGHVGPRDHLPHAHGLAALAERHLEPVGGLHDASRGHGGGCWCRCRCRPGYEASGDGWAQGSSDQRSHVWRRVDQFGEGRGGEGESNGVVDPGLKERYGYGSVWCSSSEQGSAGIFLCRYGPLCNVGV